MSMAGSTTVPAASPSRAARAAPCPRHQGLRRHQPPALPTVIPRQAVRLRDRLCSRGGGWRRAEGIFQLPQVPVQLPCFRKRNLWKARRPVHSRRHFPYRSVDPDPDPVLHKGVLERRCRGQVRPDKVQRQLDFARRQLPLQVHFSDQG